MNKLFNFFFLVIITEILILGGLGTGSGLTVTFTFFVCLLVLLQTKILKEKVMFPRGSNFYAVFIIIFVISLFWSQGKDKTFEYLNIFITGGLLWIIFYNLKKEIIKRFELVLITVGFSFGLIAIYYLLTNKLEIRPRSLVFPNSKYLNHNHIGDFWVIILVIVFYYLLSNYISNYKKVTYWLMVAIGVFFLFISQSRSAYISLAGAVLYFLYKRKKVNKNLVSLFLGGLAILFLIISMGKTTIFARGYFIQSLMGLFIYPWGVGMGNFQIISDRTTGLVGNFSNMTHNIFLEVTSGIGFLGFTFIIWFLVVLKNILENKSKNILYKAIFLALTINFFFDTTYFIPSMFWIWLISLGLSQV